MQHIKVLGHNIAYQEEGHGEQTLVFVHGNSMSSSIFDKQLSSSLKNKFRMLAFDLPGHGKSDNAIDPEATYTLPGYTAIIQCALEKLEVKAPIVIGFSLGGNIALELSATGIDLMGLIIIGCNPLPHDTAHILDGYAKDIDMDFLNKDCVSDTEVEDYAKLVLQGAVGAAPKFIFNDVKRTDGRSRPILMTSIFSSHFLDQAAWVSTCSTPLAMILGENDRTINHQHLRSLTYGNLWRGDIQVIPGACHAPFRDVADEFNALLEAFVETACARPKKSLQFLPPN